MSVMYKRMQGLKEGKARMQQSVEHDRGHRAVGKMRGWQRVDRKRTEKSSALRKRKTDNLKFGYHNYQRLRYV